MMQQHLFNEGDVGVWTPREESLGRRHPITRGGRLCVEDELEDVQLERTHGFFVRDTAKLGADVAGEGIDVVSPAGNGQPSFILGRFKDLARAVVINFIITRVQI